MRDIKADVVKGIGIIMVVLGHAGMPKSNILFRFHMALFFIISGYLFDEKNIDTACSLIKYLLRRIKNLYIPFLIYNGLFTILNNFFLQINFYTDNTAFLQTSMGGGNAYGIKQYMSTSEIFTVLNQNLRFTWEQQFGGATWFLRVLFGVTVLWAVSNFLVAKIAKNRQLLVLFNWIFSIFLLIKSNYYQKEDLHFLLQFETVASSYIMYCSGYYLKKILNIKVSTNNAKQMNILHIAFLFNIIILINCDTVCNLLQWNSNVNNYNYWAMYIVSSFSGFACVFIVSNFLENIDKIVIKKLKLFIAQAGKYSLYILMFHFIAFKAITFIQILIYHQPLYRLASFPCFINWGGWWLLYTLVGITIPMGIGNIIIRFQKSFKIFYRITKIK